MTGPKPIAIFSLRRAALACLSAVMAVLSLAPGAGAAAKPVILDTDICDDIDDTWALALLLQSPELDCKLVTTAVGNTEAKARVVARFLDRVGRADIPVGIGVKQHDGTHRQMDWVQGYGLSTYPGTIHQDGVQTLIDTVMNLPGLVTIIALGPLPNIAAALEREPRIAEKANFVGMHGSIYKGYGGSDKPSAEYNVVADAKACRKVFTAGWPITITPLDTCGLIHLRGDKYQKVLRRNSAITSNLIQNYRAWQADGLKGERKGIDAANLARLVNNQLNSASSTLFDTVAVYLAINTDLVRMEQLPVEVTDDGYTKIVEGAKVINCAVEWKSLDGFEGFLVERLTK
ncbi:MAG: nucleoside hydrolase [Sedimentisphaerales bacterium]|jgi:inosine-uridine nucleoside N-ribohydrolase|nr:nucleoside hydrolase [Sedimentisphaerales bacterium]HNY78697.1 nucleoside hydrolase [Sedimentisphaerales bacterium]HOC63892.1 nucleoside hydrolase [Sedimentisphaerales bacterium]HOH64690.1 nucleoside hydrolase [Sedimentisphaerales bacterium]HPY50814.1 nucleoside hydrolase [Sedimentisphaerales bacterium]